MKLKAIKFFSPEEISTFDFDQTTKGYELAIETEAKKSEYIGKPRGRRPRLQSE